MNTDTVRPKMIVGNWKMYKTIQEAAEFVKRLPALVDESSAAVGLAVPFTALMIAADVARGTPIRIGAQNMYDAENGAFTGEISALMLRDAGAQFVLLGHSERRNLFQESNTLINRKVKRALGNGLQVILCVGETLDQYAAGETASVITSQLTNCLEGVAADDVRHIIIAYEPVWAIGTDKTATPEIAAKVHHMCREYCARKFGRDYSDNMQILYGGSVKPENAKDLLIQPEIDGLLVGGASLSLDSFVKIVNTCPFNKEKIL